MRSARYAEVKACSSTAGKSCLVSDSTKDVSTAKWIRAIEENAFSNFGCAKRTYDRNQTKAILRNTTLLNFIKGDSKYTDHIVDDIFPPLDCYKELDLKRFVFLDYPLVVAELVTRPEYINAIRGVNSGLLPLRFGRELNACATLSPSGRPVIFLANASFHFYQTMNIEAHRPGHLQLGRQWGVNIDEKCSRLKMKLANTEVDRPILTLICLYIAETSCP